MSTHSELNWFKSSYSSGSGACVEVAVIDPATTAVRDSKNPVGPALILDVAKFQALVRAASRDQIRRG